MTNDFIYDKEQGKYIFDGNWDNKYIKFNLVATSEGRIDEKESSAIITITYEELNTLRGLLKHTLYELEFKLDNCEALEIDSDNKKSLTEYYDMIGDMEGAFDVSSDERLHFNPYTPDIRDLPEEEQEEIWNRVAHHNYCVANGLDPDKFDPDDYIEEDNAYWFDYVPADKNDEVVAALIEMNELREILDNQYDSSNDIL